MSYVHRQFQNSAIIYQLALGTYDDELYHAIDQRIEEKYGKDVKAKQFNDQFPNGVKSSKSYRSEFGALIKIMAADDTIDFVNGQNIMNGKTSIALQAWRDGFTLKPTDKCTTGVHLDLQIVIDFIDAYDEGFDEFKNENKKWEQRALYWRCVFGLIESRAPYFVAMALNEKNDFFAVMKGKKKVTRDTVVKDNSDFFDIRLGDSRYILYGSGGGAYGAHPTLGYPRRLTFLEKFCQAHTEKLGKLKGQLQQPTNSHLHEINHRRESCCQIV